MSEQLPTDNGIYLFKKFHLQSVLVAVTVSFFLFYSLALKTHFLLWRLGQKGKLAWGHVEKRQACFRSHISILAGGEIAWVVLYCKTGVISSVTLACLHTYRHQSCPFRGPAEAGKAGGEVEGLWSRKYVGDWCNSIFVPWICSDQFFKKIFWFCNYSVCYWHDCCIIHLIS